METEATLEKLYRKRISIEKIKTSEKNEKAWERLEQVGKAISEKWKSKEPSWKIISQLRK